MCQQVVVQQDSPTELIRRVKLKLLSTCLVVRQAAGYHGNLHQNTKCYFVFTLRTDDVTQNESYLLQIGSGLIAAQDGQVTQVSLKADR